MNTFTTTDMLKVLETLPKRDIKIDSKDNQYQVIEHRNGPLWIIAGPGSGKTEVLVLRCLKLLLVDHVDPRSIMITTFTEKAGRSLQDRLILYKDFIASKIPSLKEVDLTQLRVGTLHSLCNDILLEYRFPDYRNFKPMDDMEQLLFIYFNSSIAGRQNKLTNEQLELFDHFSYLFDRIGQNVMKAGKTPSRWARASFAQSLFNRMVEYRPELSAMKKEGGVYKTAVNEFLEYEQALQTNYRVDFAHMQSKFLDFLSSPRGKLFIDGGAKPDDPGLKHVLVDEYQDTNPIQAEIYFKLAAQEPHNLVVVGDDDQALYRFRGGTVDSMILFDSMCKNQFGIQADRVPLVENHRSHAGIVTWCNDYITSFGTMNKPGARVANKETLIPKSTIRGDWPPVRLIVGRSAGDLAEAFANTISDFKKNNVIEDYSDCVLLIHSTKETRTWAGPYADALRDKGIPIYNPRARQFLEEEEVELALGALLSVIDKKRNYLLVPNWIQEKCNDWRQVYENQASQYPELRSYVLKATTIIEQAQKEAPFKSTLQDVFYHIINQEPFVSWCEDTEKAVRLGYLTSIIEAYSSTPIPGYAGLSRGSLRASKQNAGEISLMWRSQFYNALVTLMVQQGLNDPENEETIYPKGKVPLMTIHQAKGLEFPVVFVAKIDEKSEPSSEHFIEDELNQFRLTVRKKATPEQRAREDRIRLFFVAYSRARYALFMLLKASEVTPGENPGEVIGLGGKSLNWLMKKVTIQEI